MRGRVIASAIVVTCAWAASCATSDDSKQQSPTPDAAPTIRCGDGICAASEIGACSADCGSPPMAMCGNGTCEAGESQASCPGDCAASAICGDGTCSGPTETNANCPGDCGSGSGSGSGSATCGNAICEAGETGTSCPLDCSGGSGSSTCPGGDDVGCFFCWFDPTQCIPPQTEQICEQCLGLGP